MLQSLSIKNYAIIEDLDVRFNSGLNIITGETGAGKSIILGALGLILGERAVSKQAKDPEKKTVVEGIFHVKDYDLEFFFKDNDLDYDPEVIIRREISTSGRSRAFINDSPVSNKILQALCAYLIDVHNQFDTLDIQRPGFQMRLIDALADNVKLVSEYRKGYNELNGLRSELDRLTEVATNSLREQDYLQFQYSELERAALQPNEDVQLEEEKQLLEKSGEIEEACLMGSNYLEEEEGSVLSRLNEYLLTVRKLADINADWKSVADRLESVRIEVADLVSEISSLSGQTEQDPQRLVEIENRLNEIYRLQQKHNTRGVGELIELTESLENKLNQFSSLDQEIEQLTNRISDLESVLEDRAMELSKRRRNIIHNFEQKVQERLQELAMPYARLQVRMERTDELRADGKDDVIFEFSANKGMPFQDLKSVASGGEMSRLSLAIKSLIADAMTLPTLIFDEIDTGVSGDAALSMGSILEKISSNHQLICITHSPQVAVRADQHLFVYKEVIDDETQTGVRYLNPEERIEAVAIMIGGSPPGAKAIENARELMRSGK